MDFNTLFFIYLSIILLTIIPIKMGNAMTKFHINNLSKERDKQVGSYILPIKNTYNDSYIKVEIIKRGITTGDFMDDTYYRINHYIGNKLQITYDLDHYEMAKDSILTSSILNERTLDYTVSKEISKNDENYFNTYMDILYLSIHRAVEKYENTNKIISRYKKLVKDEFSDV